VNLCIVCEEPCNDARLCPDCFDGVMWARSQKLQQDHLRRELTVTDWGMIVCEVEALLERSPEMRSVEDKLWDYLLSRIHPIHGKWSEAAYAETRSKLCEYLYDHLGKRPNPVSKPTPPEYTDWLWVVTEILGFFKDNPALRQVEPECWEWMLNQTYPLPPNHAPTARNMTKAILEQYMGDYGPTVKMIMEMEGRLAAEKAARVEAERVLRDAPELLEGVPPGLLTPEAAQQLEEQPKPTTKRRR